MFLHIAVTFETDHINNLYCHINLNALTAILKLEIEVCLKDLHFSCHCCQVCKNYPWQVISYFNRKKNIDEELAEIEPLVKEAKEAVSNIKSEALTEIRYRRLVVYHYVLHESFTILDENIKESKEILSHYIF